MFKRHACATAIASMDTGVDSMFAHLVSEIVGVRMPDTVGTDPLHECAVVAPMRRPVDHMVLRGVVDHARAPTAISFVVNVDKLLACSSDIGVICLIHKLVDKNWGSLGNHGVDV